MCMLIVLLSLIHNFTFETDAPTYLNNFIIKLSKFLEVEGRKISNAIKMVG